ncbi:MAG: tetratricopeptide repeat protein [Myxococcota bacterium]|nr:tetratricopeptide repeat protein [Myxococcota bacterium]
MTRLSHTRFPHLSHWTLVLLLGVGSVGATGCKDDEEGTTSEGGESSTGGESSGGETASGGVEAPSGSSQPSNPDEWDGDPAGGSAGGSTTTGQTGGTAGGTGGTGTGGTGTTAPAANPWGATQAEQCRPPARREMNASALRVFNDGVRAAAGGNTADAQRSFERALAEDSGAFKAAYNLGVLADRAGQENRALELYRQSLRIQADYEKALEGMVTIFYRRNSVPEALALVEPIAQRFPTNLHVQALYAEVLTRAQRYEQAWDAARRALRCDERFVPALLATVKTSLAQGRRELAESILTQALSIDADVAELHFIRGTLLREDAARYREALEAFRNAVRLRPDYGEARLALGIAELGGGNYDQALQHFQAAARLSPTLVAVHLNLGEAYRATKQWEKAKASFDKALQMDSNLAQAHYNLGLMYRTAGAEFPGLDALQAMQRAKEELTRYRNLMGPRLRRDDPTTEILADLDRQIEREQRRLEREARAREREAARPAPTEGGTE